MVVFRKYKIYSNFQFIKFLKNKMYFNFSKFNNNEKNCFEIFIILNLLKTKNLTSLIFNL